MKSPHAPPRLAAALLGFVAACASAPPPVVPSWIPPPQAASCSEAAPCDTVRQWFTLEKEAAEAWPACHPVPLKGTAEACARADAAYAKAHASRLDYLAGLCSGTVGVSSWFVLPYVGAPESDRVATCGARPGATAFTCRIWEWTWATSSKGGAFVIFLVPPEGAPAGTWVLNSCSYCETGAPCREFPARR